MSLLRELKLKARQVTAPVIAAGLVGYFAYHAIEGDRGVRSWLQLRYELDQAAATEAALAGQREQLARQVRLLRRDGLDTDLLDERAHLLLNYGREDEYVVFLGDDQDPGP